MIQIFCDEAISEVRYYRLFSTFRFASFAHLEARKQYDRRIYYRQRVSTSCSELSVTVHLLIGRVFLCVEAGSLWWWLVRSAKQRPRETAENVQHFITQNEQISYIKLQISYKQLAYWADILEKKFRQRAQRNGNYCPWATTPEYIKSFQTLPQYSKYPDLPFQYSFSAYSVHWTYSCKFTFGIALHLEGIYSTDER